jgi:hypothetical protein
VRESRPKNIYVNTHLERGRERELVVEKIGISLVARGLKKCPTAAFETKRNKSEVRFMHT